jgi:pyridoxal/pyridoxine/pyridoxamine kinase
VAHGHSTSIEDEDQEASIKVMLDELSCPISIQLMTDPVMADDGHTYQRDAIEAWINKCTSGRECGYL